LSELPRRTALDAIGAQCNRCGRCCQLHGGDLPASARDIERWQNAGAKGAEILTWVSPAGDASGRPGELWLDPTIGKRWEKPGCPWGREEPDGAHRCVIYDLRPDACRTFPDLPGQVEVICKPGGLESIGR